VDYIRDFGWDSWRFRVIKLKCANITHCNYINYVPKSNIIISIKQHILNNDAF
jgi:hypothetical protein